MSLARVYVQAVAQIPSLFRKIQEGQAPSKFTIQHLKDLGFTSSNHRAFIPLLKALGFLADDGTPTKRYHDYRNSAQARGVLAQALREAYKDLFFIKENPTAADKKTIQGKFKSTHNSTDRLADLMTSTFLRLLTLADLGSAGSPRVESTPTAESQEGRQDEGPQDSVGLVSVREGPAVGPPVGLNYNIQVHLPATKDIEVYNAIFKSLREHLLG